MEIKKIIYNNNSYYHRLLLSNVLFNRKDIKTILCNNNSSYHYLITKLAFNRKKIKMTLYNITFFIVFKIELLQYLSLIPIYYFFLTFPVFYSTIIVFILQEIMDIIVSITSFLILIYYKTNKILTANI